MLNNAMSFFKINLLFLLISANAFSTEMSAVESFEDNSILDYYQHSDNSKISISNKHYKFGQHSLHWQWQGKNHLTTKRFRILTRDQSPLKYGKHFPASPMFVISLYSEKKQSTVLKISFDKHDREQGKQTVWFDFPLNFSGWRTTWVPFYEMKGHTPDKNSPVSYDTFSISSRGNGQVFIDDIVFSQFQDDRHPYPSLQTPFIQRQTQKTASDHWMPLLSNLQRINNLPITPLQNDDIEQLIAIEDKISSLLHVGKTIPDSLISLKHAFTQLGLVNNGETIQGPPLSYALSQVYFNEVKQGKKRHTSLRNFGKLLKKIAQHYVDGAQKDKVEIKKMFIQAVRYYLDQGWQSGTSMGTLHHIGYSTRELTEAFYLMRKPLLQAGILNDVGASLQWLFNFGKLLDDKKNFHANIDYMNTQSFYHLLLIFLNDDRAMQATLLHHFSNYISFILAQNDSQGVFKIDGTAWHHGGHYPAYALGAFEKIPQLIYALSASRFKIAETGHANFKKAFLASRIYSQPFDFGFGNAGRHPFDGSFSGLQQQYLQLALAGDPQHNNTIDKDVAAAYLRLWGNDKENSAVFKQYNVEAEDLTGYYSFPYAATAVHRQNEWAALIKGYSKYVWASEIYIASNRYGRYPANGTVQLLNEQGEKGSGFIQAGWNWNHFPGATVINLPIEQLETTKPLLMFRSNESFTGSVQLNHNGLFAMQLNEGQGFNHEGNEKETMLLSGELKAKKSVFSFNDKLIFVGTDISSSDSQNPVQTNLFQSYLTEKAQPMATSASGRITKFPYQATLPLKTTTLTKKSNDGDIPSDWLIDPYGNGYHLLSANNVTINRKHQHSFHNKYSLFSGKMNRKGKGVSKTEGNFASAWFDHGIAPENGAYQYVIYPFISNSMSQKEISNFAKRTSTEQTYKVLQANSQAHIVTDHTTKTTGYALFSAKSSVQHGLLAATSSPALVMIQQLTSQTATLSVVQPDLNFVQLKPIEGYSQPSPLTITLQGKWQVSKNMQVTSVAYFQGNTEINLICQHGLPVKFDVKKLQ